MMEQNFQIILSSPGKWLNLQEGDGGREGVFPGCTIPWAREIPIGSREKGRAVMCGVREKGVGLCLCMFAWVCV